MKKTFIITVLLILTSCTPWEKDGIYTLYRASILQMVMTTIKRTAVLLQISFSSSQVLRFDIGVKKVHIGSKNAAIQAENIMETLVFSGFYNPITLRPYDPMTL